MMDLKENMRNDVLGKVPYYMLGAILLIRFFAIWFMGPMPQDAYYFFYAQHPDLSYFDHPPAIAYLLKLFTAIFGKNVFALKLADSVLTVFTTIAVYKLALAFYPKYESKRVIVLFFSTLMVSILSLVSTPDTPLLFFWTFSLLALFEAIFKEKRMSWIMVGILMGLAFDSKYTAVFLPAGMLLFLLLSKSKRRFLFSIWPWLSCLIMIIVASPVIIWNVRNHFASFTFQSAQRMHSVAALELNPKLVFGLLGHQLALLIPILFISLFYTIYRIVKTYRGQWSNLPAEKIFLLCFFLPIFLAFLSLSPIYWIKINWMMPAYITGIILTSSFISQKWLKIQVLVSFLVHLALAVEIFLYPVPIRSDDTWVGWKDLSEKVETLKKQQKADFVFSADSYKTSAELNLYSKDFVYGQNVIGEHALQFDYIGTDLSKLNGHSAIFVDSDPGFKNEEMGKAMPSSVLPYFASVEQLRPIIIERNEKPVRKFLVYLCRGYRFIPKKTATDLLHN